MFWIFLAFAGWAVLAIVFMAGLYIGHAFGWDAAMKEVELARHFQRARGRAS